MIATVLKISWLRLWNNKSEFLLLFAVPILFFSIFALIFSRGVGQTQQTIPVSIINDDSSAFTEGIVRDLQSRSELRRVTGVGSSTESWPIERLSRTIISKFDADIVIYFPAGFSDSLGNSQPQAVRIMNEGTNPLGSQIVEAVVAQSVAQSIAQSVAQSHSGRKASRLGNSQFSLASAQRSPAQPQLTESDVPMIAIENLNIFATNKHQPKIAMYAAGIAVMFLLFSSSGAGASLLEENEAGTLERLLTSKLTIGQLLLGKWIYISALGFTQISIMFLWGQLVFQVDLLGHLPGFVIMSLATSFACASFALCLATLCRSRNQLNGVSLVLIPSMSALGGSMIPRYIMSESMQRLGRFTFNGWALDGYKKIFWYDLPVSAIKLEVAVLLIITVLLGLVARLCARRWSFA